MASKNKTEKISLFSTSRVAQHIVENHKAGMSKAGDGLVKIS
jgi:hypothetical protein